MTEPHDRLAFHSFTSPLPVTMVYDFTGANVGTVSMVPGTLAAGYVTGSGDVPWTSAQFSHYPNAVRIDQSPVNTPADMTADVYDMEANAGTLAGLPEWVHGAWASYTSGQRPGQRTPTVYCQRSNVTPVTNTLLAAGITHGVSLWIAASSSSADAITEVQQASGPFPVIGRQYLFYPTYDVSVFSASWLGTVSKAPAPPKLQPGTQTGWGHCAKCQGLFYVPGAAESVCPAGGQHNGGHSHSYELGFVW